MLELFYILVVEQVCQGLFSVWQGIQWLLMARRRMAAPAGFYAPRVALLCPVKGMEPGIDENLRALITLDYLHYEIFFVVASRNDAAYPLLTRLAAASSHPVHIVCAGYATDCGEKVNNLRVAVEQLDSRFDVLVFTDSDGRPPRRWLGRLVAPLADVRLGAVTTFRWLIPEQGSFWAGLVSAWNASIATHLGEHSHNFCWGGGTAMRRDRFDELQVAETWRNSLSDDYSLTNAIRSAGFDIAFAPECLVPSLIQMDRRQLLEFTNRQLIITRVYAPKLWLTAALGHLFYCATLFTGLAVFCEHALSGLPMLPIVVIAAVPPVLAAIRGLLRFIAATDLLPEWRAKLLANAWAWTLLAPVVPFLFLYNSAVAAFRRRIIWRGTRYELVSAAKTRVLSR